MISTPPVVPVQPEETDTVNDESEKRVPPDATEFIDDEYGRPWISDQDSESWPRKSRTSPAVGAEVRDGSFLTEAWVPVTDEQDKEQGR